MIRSFVVRAMCGVLVCAAAGLGCQSSGRDAESGGTGILRAGLPPGAKVVAEGTAQLTYTAPESGQIFLYNMTTDRVVGRFHLRTGQRLALDGTTGRATIDGNELRVASPGKTPGSYQIYFLRDPMQPSISEQQP